MTRHTYRPRDPMLRDIYRKLVEQGEGIDITLGGVTNAYLVARRTGQAPQWAKAGTPVYAGAQAGLYHWRATRAAKAKQ